MKLAENKRAHREKCKRDTSQLVEAIDKMVSDACVEAAKPKSEVQSAKPKAKRAKKEMQGVQTHDARGKKRGGWYNRCQLMMECFLTEHDELAMRLCEQFFHGNCDEDEDEPVPPHASSSSGVTAKDEPVMRTSFSQEWGGL